MRARYRGAGADGAALSGAAREQLEETASAVSGARPPVPPLSRRCHRTAQAMRAGGCRRRRGARIGGRAGRRGRDRLLGQRVGADRRPVARDAGRQPQRRLAERQGGQPGDDRAAARGHGVSSAPCSATAPTRSSPTTPPPSMACSAWSAPSGWSSPPYGVRVNSVDPTVVHTDMVDEPAPIWTARRARRHHHRGSARTLPSLEHPADPMAGAASTSPTPCCSSPPTRPGSSPA